MEDARFHRVSGDGSPLQVETVEKGGGQGGCDVHTLAKKLCFLGVALVTVCYKLRLLRDRRELELEL